ncbi:N-acetylglutaminylglutamine amidotransferase [Burkholderiaceae bacterium FT117]|uniref:N-acetylglutaminylglutamine amidotransferase n=1 Tax=Zeimonas sediminis TaxID=2944268 RepID=UPI002342D663|nr:N-acetylglutaminylglutamine amidotransferase [Zeimonas sediminis]MCM5570342.1 N-acetylglutaminylglutamine amidotransferase [Zeimonas sediminis]
MCGFAGEARFDSSAADIGTVARMGEVLQPRGPDASGAFQQGGIALAHRRLRIIDLSENAQQPMTDPSLGLTVAFNGCIYNYRELRRELEALDYRFFSDGDTEVVLKSFHAWGRDCVSRFHGMFAFAMFERDSGRLTLARDRFGIKPLYLAERAGRLRFASSLPALLAGGEVDTAIDPAALHHYMSWHAVVPPPMTILAGIRKLPPATVATWDAEGRCETNRFWGLKVQADPALAALPAEERERLTEDALRTAVRRRMVADVPVGVLLSGGVDSSLIVALLAEAGQHDLRTFSIGFEAAGGESGDEFVYSDMVAKRFATKHTQIRIPTSELMGALPGTIAAMSEPMVSYDNVAFYLLSREVSKHLKVVQSGQGADEVFAGYHWYPKLAASTEPTADYARAFFDRDHAEYLATVGEAFATDDHSRAFLEREFAAGHGGSAVEKALHLDTTVMLADDPVKRVDNMTMAWGLEARVPFLDHELVELAGRLPAADKLGDGGKGVLKSIARRLVPREVVDRPKGYFPVPILKYIDGPVLEMVRDALGSRAARERGLFRPDAVAKLLAAPSDHITPLRGSKLWQVALLELWLQARGL